MKRHVKISLRLPFALSVTAVVFLYCWFKK